MKNVIALIFATILVANAAIPSAAIAKQRMVIMKNSVHFSVDGVCHKVGMNEVVQKQTYYATGRPSEPFWKLTGQNDAKAAFALVRGIWKSRSPKTRAC